MIGLAKLAAGPGNMALVERPEPTAGPGRVVLEVLGIGICGTDLHIQAGEYPSVPPVTIGHEVCGIVQDVGADVDADWLGARVVIETYDSACERCRMCRAGRRNMCTQRKSLGTHVDGGAAPRMSLPVINLHRVPDTIGSSAATLSEPLACVCNSLLDPPVVSAGDAVLVVGPGAMGLLAAQVARYCGGRVTIRGTSTDGERLRLAEALGFDAEVVSRDEPPADITNEGRFDVAIECSGAGPGIAYALGALRRRGVLVQIGLRGTDVTVPWDLICFHELSVRSGFASTPRSWLRAIALLEAGGIECESLVTATVPLADWTEAFDASRQGSGVKYVLDPTGVA